MRSYFPPKIEKGNKQMNVVKLILASAFILTMTVGVENSYVYGQDFYPITYSEEAAAGKKCVRSSGGKIKNICNKEISIKWCPRGEELKCFNKKGGGYIFPGKVLAPYEEWPLTIEATEGYGVCVGLYEVELERGSYKCGTQMSAEVADDPNCQRALSRNNRDDWPGRSRTMIECQIKDLKIRRHNATGAVLEAIDDALKSLERYK